MFEINCVFLIDNKVLNFKRRFGCRGRNSPFDRYSGLALRPRPAQSSLPADNPTSRAKDCSTSVRFSVTEGGVLESGELVDNGVVDSGEFVPLCEEISGISSETYDTASLC